MNDPDMILSDDLVTSLRQLKSKEASVPQMLFKIQNSHKIHSQITVLSMMYLREAFGLSLRDVLPIGGWRGFGGELSDDQVNGFVAPIIYGN